MKKSLILKNIFVLIMNILLSNSINLYSQIDNNNNDTVLIINDFTLITDTSHNQLYFDFYYPITKAIIEVKGNLDTNELFYCKDEVPVISDGYITFHIWTKEAINDFKIRQMQLFYENKVLPMGPYGGLIYSDFYIKFVIETKQFVHIYQVE